MNFDDFDSLTPAVRHKREQAQIEVANSERQALEAIRKLAALAEQDKVYVRLALAALWHIATVSSSAANAMGRRRADAVQQRGEQRTYDRRIR